MLTHGFYTHLAVCIRQQAEQQTLFMALGEGHAEWDRVVPDNGRDRIRMENEVFRKRVALENITYLDERDTPSERPTPTLQFNMAFIAGEGVGTIRECGLFGGASADERSGTLLSYSQHVRIEKSIDMSLARHIIIRLVPNTLILNGHQSRYLGNAVTEELHDLENESGSCQIDELRMDRRSYFPTVEHALSLGYDYCAHCFGRDLSQR